MEKIKIGYLVSYDYDYIFQSIPRVYGYVDEIILSIDIDRLSWAGHQITIPQSFFDRIKALDVANKIVLHEDKFHFSDKTTMECETNQRNLLSQKMGADCWQLQIDADEYFIHFEAVVDFLRQRKYLLRKASSHPVLIKGSWITLFKKVPGGYLYIDNAENFSFGTNQVSGFTFARRIRGAKEIKTSTAVVHQSWARTEEEVQQKISNWGHKDDFDVQAFYRFWQSLNRDNYLQVRDFHPLSPQEWHKLEFIACTTIDEFIEQYKLKAKRKQAIENRPLGRRIVAYLVKKQQQYAFFNFKKNLLLRF